MEEDKSNFKNTITPPVILIAPAGTDIGRGVFAAKPFLSGEIIEESPVIILNESFDDLPREFRLRVFNWAVLSKLFGGHAFALGYGGMYNHIDQPNLSCGRM